MDLKRMYIFEISHNDKISLESINLNMQNRKVEVDDYVTHLIIENKRICIDKMFCKGRKEEAYNAYIKIDSTQNNPAIQWRIAQCLYHGWGVVQNKEKAYVYFDKAAKQGYAHARYFIAAECISGINVDKNARKGIEVLNELFKCEGHSGAAYTLGILYLKGEMLEQNYIKAFELIKYAAEKNHYFAIMKLVEMYRNGIGILKSEIKAEEWEEKSKYAPKGTEEIFVEKLKQETNKIF